MSRAHTTKSGLRAGKTLASVSLLAMFLTLGCGNSGGKAGGTGGSHSGGGTTGVRRRGIVSRCERESRGNHGLRRLASRRGHFV